MGSVPRGPPRTVVRVRPTLQGGGHFVRRGSIHTACAPRSSCSTHASSVNSLTPVTSSSQALLPFRVIGPDSHCRLPSIETANRSGGAFGGAVLLNATSALNRLYSLPSL